ncbi:MAG: TniQ family protein [Verrucomicrobiia bacterium]
MNTTTFPAWESTWPELPTRTRLFNLEPIGLGTPYVESLTSYIGREASEHQVPPWFIVSKDIAPKMARKTLAEPSGHSDLYGKMGASLNGFCSTAVEVVRIMEELTGRSGLAELTMQRWGHVFAQTGLVRKYRAWCPVCFEEWKVKSRPIYEPLFWAMKETDVCVDHFVPLATQCPKCNKAHGLLTWYSKPGYCPRCKSWLGYNAFDQYCKQPESLSSINKWRRFKSLGVGHLVAVRPEQITAGTTEIFSRNIRFLCDHVFKGNVSEFARLAHHSRLTLKKWAAGEQLPQLLSVLFLAYRFKLLPQNLLLAELPGDRSLDIRQCPDQVTVHVKRRKRKRDQEGIRNYLQLTLNAKIDPPPSFRRVCIRAQIDQGQIAKAFPDLARQIMERYKNYVNKRTAERRGNIVAALRQAILKINGRGEFPTLERTRRELEDPNWLLEKWVRVEWKRIAAEMGFIRYGPPIKPSAQEPMTPKA